ncbi:MAG: M48 family metallopeptidase [Verrucomicrobiota bacterium]
MDFFEQQEKARRDTRLLLVYFALSVLLVVALTYLIVAPFILSFHGRRGIYAGAAGFIAKYITNVFMLLFKPAAFFRWVWNPMLFCQIAGVTVAFIVLGSLWKMRQLAAGGAAVAEILDARPLSPETDPDEQKLTDVVEEMAVAAQSALPQVYVLDDERGINAFAAGYTADDIVIIVTRGCLRLLDRDEMQAVIAHEFSHIVNGDTLLKMRLTGWVHGILLLDTIGRQLSQAGGDGGDLPAAQAPALILGSALRVVGSIGVPFCRLIKSAVFREREWLADAAAVQFTRNPLGLVGALEKIGGLSKKGRLDSPEAETISHLFFVSYTFESWMPFLASHPPLEKRIRAVDPSFDGAFPKVPMLPISAGERNRVFDQAVGALLAQSRKNNGGQTTVGEDINTVVKQIQTLGAAPMILGQNLHAAVQTPWGAAAFTYALLFSVGDKRTDAQYAQLQKEAPAAHELALRMEPQVSALDDHRKLALLDQALPSLRQLKLDDYNAWVRNVNDLCKDRPIASLFEYTVSLILCRLVPEKWVEVRRPEISSLDLPAVEGDCALLLSAVSNNDPADPQTAFNRGVAELDFPPASISLLNAANCDLIAVHRALERVNRCSLVVKQNIVWACANAAKGAAAPSGDQVLLLRAMAESLRCQLPAFARWGGPAPDPASQ